MSAYLYRKQKLIHQEYEDSSERLLSGECKETFDHFIQDMQAKKMKPHCYGLESYHLNYKGRLVIRFLLGGEHANECNQIKLYMTVAEKESLDTVVRSMDEETRRFYFQHLRRCTRCNPKHGAGRKYIICGKEYRICSEPEMMFDGPTAEELAKVEQFVDLRMKDISNLVYEK